MSETKTYIQELQEERSKIDRRILELQSEVRAIDNIIYRRRSEDLALMQGAKANGKNGGKLFFEALILDILNNSNAGLRTAEIRDHIVNRGYKLNYNTLRSYVTDMRDKEIIKKASPRSYRWIAG